MTLPKIRLLNGDSRLILPELPDASFDVMATDPPYGVPMWAKVKEGEEEDPSRPGYRFDWHLDDADVTTAKMSSKAAKSREKSDALGLITWTLDQAARLVKEDGYVYMTLGDNVYADAVVAARKIGFKVKAWAWVKPNPMMPFPNSAYRNNLELVLFAYRRLPNSRMYYGGGVPNYVEVNAPRGKKRGHPTQKPEALFDAWFSQTPGRWIDPFMGSGTAAAVGAQLGLPGLGIEKNTEYFEFAKARVKAIREQQARES